MSRTSVVFTLITSQFNQFSTKFEDHAEFEPEGDYYVTNDNNALLTDIHFDDTYPDDDEVKGMHSALVAEGIPFDMKVESPKYNEYKGFTEYHRIDKNSKPLVMTIENGKFGMIEAKRVMEALATGAIEALTQHIQSELYPMTWEEQIRTLGLEA